MRFDKLCHDLSACADTYVHVRETQVRAVRALGGRHRGLLRMVAIAKCLVLTSGKDRDPLVFV